MNYAQFALLHLKLSEQGRPITKCLDSILTRYSGNAMHMPIKWSNVTQKVQGKIKSHAYNDLAGFCWNEPSQMTIGHHCDKIGLREICRIQQVCIPVDGVNVGVVIELLKYKSQHGFTWVDVYRWLSVIFPEHNSNERQVKYRCQRLLNQHSRIKKNRPYDMDAFLHTKCSTFELWNETPAANISHPKVRKIEKENKKLHGDLQKCKSAINVLSTQTHALREEKIKLSAKKSTSKDIHALDRTHMQKELKRLTNRKHKQEKKILQLTKINAAQRTVNYYKRLKRREQDMERERQYYVNKKLNYKLQLTREIRNRTIIQAENIALKRKHKTERHRLSASNTYYKNQHHDLQRDLHKTKVDLENEKQNVIALLKEVETQSEVEPLAIQTLTGKRYSNDIRECIMELQGLGISAVKTPHVIQTVSRSLHHCQINNQDLPSRTTIQKIVDEAHVLAQTHATEKILETVNWDLFYDGTSREGKKVLDYGVVLGDNSTLALGFRAVAKEDSQTVSTVLKDVITNLATAGNGIDGLDSVLKKQSGVMSDRSSVNKKANGILEEWRRESTEDDVDPLNTMYCTAHVILGFQNKVEKVLRQPANADCSETTDTDVVRLVQTASDVLGPRGDERSGVRQDWLAYLDMKNKPSHIISFRGNRFNSTFEGSAAVFHHRKEITDLLSNYKENRNRKLELVLKGVENPTNLAQLRALGLAYVHITGPFWDLCNSQVKYLDLHTYIEPLRQVLQLQKLDGSLLMQEDVSVIPECTSPSCTRAPEVTLTSG
jgi:hypothetical protein